jgi:hypothetical protein
LHQSLFPFQMLQFLINSPFCSKFSTFDQIF